MRLTLITKSLSSSSMLAQVRQHGVAFGNFRWRSGRRALRWDWNLRNRMFSFSGLRRFKRGDILYIRHIAQRFCVSQKLRSQCRKVSAEFLALLLVLKGSRE